MISAFCIEITADFCYIFFDYFRKNITFAIDNYLLREYNSIHHAKSLVIIIFFEKNFKKGLDKWGKRWYTNKAVAKSGGRFLEN